MLTVACKPLQNLPLLYLAALFPFSQSSPAPLCPFAVSLSCMTRGLLSLFFLLPGTLLLQTVPVCFLTAFRVSDQTDLRKAFLYYSIKLQPILSSHLRSLSPFLALLFSKALNTLQHAT